MQRPDHRRAQELVESIQAVPPAYQQIFQERGRLASGGFFTDADNDSARNVAVIGQTVATNLFPAGTSPVGQQIQVRNVPFTVVGLLASKGAGFGGDQDDTILIPFKAGQIRLFGATNINSILVQADSADDMTRMTTDITSAAHTRHKIQACRRRRLRSATIRTCSRR